MKISHDRQHGGSAAEFLVVAVVAAIAAVFAIFAFPSLLSSGRSEAPVATLVRSEANEAAAIAGLRAIASAEAAYAVGEGSGSYGTLDDLLSAGLIDSRWKGAATISGYRFALTLDPAGGKAFCAVADRVSDTSGGYSYAVSNRGALYRIAGGQAPTCDASTGNITSGTVLGG